MANYEIRPLQLHILKILSAVDKVCREHNLRYYIVDGTMLGAVRHGGFIPWDDDMDIGMPRKDYNILIKNAEQWLPAPYNLVCGENNKDYPLPFAKVEDTGTTVVENTYFKHIGGVYIDVFPLDGMPDNKKAQRKHLRKHKSKKKLLYFMSREPYKHGKGIRAWFTLFLQKVIGTPKAQKMMRELQTKYDYDQCEYCINYDDGAKSIMPKSVMGKPTPIQFEGETFMGVEHADTYLTYIYGDYMQVPPKDQQIPHNFYYMNLNEPYREYIKNRKNN